MQNECVKSLEWPSYYKFDCNLTRNWIITSECITSSESQLYSLCILHLYLNLSNKKNKYNNYVYQQSSDYDKSITVLFSMTKTFYTQVSLDVIFKDSFISLLP